MEQTIQQQDNLTQQGKLDMAQGDTRETTALNIDETTT
jgi:hypothetical protein